MSLTTEQTNLTPEQVKLLEAFALIMSPKTASTAAVHNRIIAARDYSVKSLSEMNAALTAITGGETMPATEPETPIPPSLDPQPEPEKASKWGKFKSVFKKVWPVATAGLLFVPGGPIVTAVVNAVAGAGTLDMATVTTAAGAAGAITAATAGVSAWRNTTKAEEAAKE